MLKSVVNFSAAESEAEAWETEDEQNVAEYVEIEYAEAGSSGTQKRGRKRKRHNSTGEVRRSSRNQVPTSFMNNDYLWSMDEKKDLLQAVKKYGHLDMDRLCEVVPGKSKSAIEAMIVKWWRRSAALKQCEIDHKPMLDRRFKDCRGKNKKKEKKTTKRSKLAPIEQWIQQLRQAASPSSYTETKILARSMLYISLFEKHPDPAECGGIDFSALYDYIYRMLMGYPPKELNEATINYLLYVMDKLIDKIKNDEFYSQMFHLKAVRKISLEPASVKQYGKRREEDQKPIAGEDGWMKSLLEIPGFNPLSTGLSLLKLE